MANHEWVSPAEFKRRRAAGQKHLLKLKAEVVRKSGLPSSYDFHHTRYRDARGRLIFGHETQKDMRLIPRHLHKKGAYGDDEIARLRREHSADEWTLWLLDLIVFGPFRLLRWLFKKAASSRTRR